MNFFNKIFDLNKVAKSIDALNIQIKELVPKIENDYNHNDLKEDIYVLAYIARRDIIDLIEDNNWSMEIKIMVSTFEKRRIPLILGYCQTVDKIQFIALTLGFDEVVNEILEKGNAYYTLESILKQNS